MDLEKWAGVYDRFRPSLSDVADLVGTMSRYVVISMGISNMIDLAPFPWDLHRSHIYP